jgi:methylated-DNA-[protein]-cysteine S-methyltransferase
MNDALKQLLLSIPKGKVTTYKAIALKLKTSPRAVGRMLGANTDLVIVPCHRVVMSTRAIGGYAGGVDTKKKLLESEGVLVIDDEISPLCLFYF